jgi:hypothetical protein
MDNNYLEHLLSTLEVVVEATAICEIGVGARLVLEPQSSIEFYYVLDGTMHLKVSDLPPLVYGAGSKSCHCTFGSVTKPGSGYRL